MWIINWIDKFLTDPSLERLGAIASIVALIIMMIRPLRKRILTFLSSLIKTKTSIIVVIIVGLGAFFLAYLISNNDQVLEDTELRKEKESLQQQLVTSRDTIQQRDKQIASINREKKAAKKELKSAKTQIETYKDSIKGKDNEINSMKKRISELEVELTDALSRVKDLETEKQELQVKISKLTKPEKETVSFVLKGKKLFLRDGDKEKELFPDYEIHCFDESKNKKKIAVICKRPTEAHTYHIKVFNADRKLSKLSTWEIKGHESEPPSNLKWTSDTVLRVNLFKSRQYSYLKVYDFSLIETGTYEITIDDLNSLLSVEKFKREPKTAKEKWIRGIEELKDRPDLPMEGIDSTR